MNNITGKTIFTFIDESGDESTLSLDKFVADKLASVLIRLAPKITTGSGF